MFSCEYCEILSVTQSVCCTLSSQPFCSSILIYPLNLKKLRLLQNHQNLLGGVHEISLTWFIKVFVIIERYEDDSWLYKGSNSTELSVTVYINSEGYLKSTLDFTEIVNNINKCTLGQDQYVKLQDLPFFQVLHIWFKIIFPVKSYAVYLKITLRKNGC